MEKCQTATYLVFADKENPVLVGCFALAIRPITVPRHQVSSKKAKKSERVSRLDGEEGIYHFSAFLIAQIGKNYNVTDIKRISGEKLLEIAKGEIAKIKVSVGGVAVFLECEEKPKLISFYENF